MTEETIPQPDIICYQINLHCQNWVPYCLIIGPKTTYPTPNITGYC